MTICYRNSDIKTHKFVVGGGGVESIKVSKFYEILYFYNFLIIHIF